MLDDTCMHGFLTGSQPLHPQRNAKKSLNRVVTFAHGFYAWPSGRHPRVQQGIQPAACLLLYTSARAR